MKGMFRLLLLTIVGGVFLLTACGSEDSNEVTEGADDPENSNEVTEGADDPENSNEVTEDADDPEKSQLSKIIDEGVIKVGTAGDYKPFTYLNPETDKFEGSDIDAAKLLAEDLGVEVEFVESSWPTLMDDLLGNKFDIGMGGITRTLERQEVAHLSKPYLDFGKGAIIRKEDENKFKSIEDMNQSDVRVGVNPGGTNEEFVLSNLDNANITEVEDNLDIPGEVAEGEFDVMITDNVEAILYANEDDRLFPAFKDEPLTNSQMGYLMNQGEEDFQNWIDLWIDQMKLDDSFEKIEDEWM